MQLTNRIISHFTSLICAVCYSVFAFPAYSFASDTNLAKQVITHSYEGNYQYLYWYENRQKTFELQREQKGNDWVNYARTQWTYQNNECTSQIQEKWIANEWETIKELKFAYSHNKLIQTTEYDRITNNALSTQTVNTYNANLLTTTTHYVANNDSWIKDYTMSYFYNQQHQLDSLIINKLDEKWCVLFTYTADNLPQQQTLLQLTDSGIVKSYRYTFFYDCKTHKLLSQKTQKWQLSDSGYDWINSQNVLYTYNSNGNLQYETYQYWNVMFWQNDMRYAYTYTDSNLPQTRTTQLPLNRKWRDISTLIYDYETAPRKETITAQYNFWSGQNDKPYQTWIPYLINDTQSKESKMGYKVEILYTNPLETFVINEIQPQSIRLYPNPSNGIYFIDNQLNKSFSWAVFSLNGTIVKADTNITDTEQIDITHCPNGVYILQIITNNGTFYQKIIKQD